jgi:hypothetical protein
MRFAILPLVIHRKSQFVPAGNDVLIKSRLFDAHFSCQMMPSKPSYKRLFLVLRLALVRSGIRVGSIDHRRSGAIPNFFPAL